MKSERVVVKVGGSLFALPDLGERLTLLAERAQPRIPVLLPGGGLFADQIRILDEVHHLPAEVSHRLAIESMSLSAQFLESLLPRGQIISSLAELQAVLADGCLPIVDLACWTDPASHCNFPASWEVTSDSLAAGLARDLSAPLLLAKSVPLPGAVLSLEEAARQGLVDHYFPSAAANVTELFWINLRDAVPDLVNWRPASCTPLKSPPARAGDVLKATL